jgi:hypothetical protein
MPVSVEDEDELVERAAEEIRASRSAGERAYVTRVAREYGVPRERVIPCVPEWVHFLMEFGVPGL